MMWVFYLCIAAVCCAASCAIGKQTLSKLHQVQKTGLEEQKRARKERIGEEERKRMWGKKGGEVGAENV